MTRTDLVNIVVLLVGAAICVTGVILAVNGSPAGIWVLVTGVVLFGVVKFSINIAQVRRARRALKNRG